jgi:hypothetical protein
LPEFIGRAGFAGIVSSRHNTAAQASVRVLKAADIVPLPAVQADADFSQSGQHLFGINAQSSITLFG